MRPAFRRCCLVGFCAFAPQLPGAATVVSSEEGVVVAGSPEACNIGVEILEAGGSAMDAAVGVSLALGVGEPYGSGLGGKLVLLHRSAMDETVEAVLGLDTAPAGVTASAARAVGRAGLTRGWTAVAVPGMLPALAEAHARWGRLQWGDCVAPVVQLAEIGAVVTEDLAAVLRKDREELTRDAWFRREFFPGDRVPLVGTRLPRTDLARTLGLIATGGADVFKTGMVADRIAGASEEGGGWFRSNDLEGVVPEVSEPSHIEWRGWKVWSAPPPVIGGATVLLSLQAMEGGGLTTWDAEGMDRVCAVLQQVYPRVRRVVSDDPESRLALGELLNGGAAKEIAEAVKADERLVPDGGESHEGDERSTTHFVVMDGDGNVVSATQSLGFKFGAGVIAPGTGVIMNNSMGNFAVISTDSPNFLRPGLRARSTMAPVIATDPMGGWLALGAPGGARIPTAVLEVMVGVGVGEISLAEAIDAPRFHLRPRIRRGDAADVIDVEDGFAGAAGLRERGWELDFHADEAMVFGGVNAAWRTRDGSVQGVADGRRSNYAKEQTESNDVE